VGRSVQRCGNARGNCLMAFPRPNCSVVLRNARKAGIWNTWKVVLTKNKFSKNYVHAACVSSLTKKASGYSQARNQLGTPGRANSFLRGAQTFWTMSNSFKQCPTHFSRRGEAPLRSLGYSILFFVISLFESPCFGCPGPSPHLSPFCTPLLVGDTSRVLQRAQTQIL